jgi:hypothetical protein
MTEPHVEPRAVAALADAIDAALDMWDDAARPAWTATDPERLALAASVASLLSQSGFTLSAIDDTDAVCPHCGESLVGS